MRDNTDLDHRLGKLIVSVSTACDVSTVRQLTPEVNNLTRPPPSVARQEESGV